MRSVVELSGNLATQDIVIAGDDGVGPKPRRFVLDGGTDRVPTERFVHWVDGRTVERRR